MSDSDERDVRSVHPRPSESDVQVARPFDMTTLDEAIYWKWPQ
jgi:hypothetical protein